VLIPISFFHMCILARNISIVIEWIIHNISTVFITHASWKKNACTKSVIFNACIFRGYMQLCKPAKGSMIVHVEQITSTHTHVHHTNTLPSQNVHGVSQGWTSNRSPSDRPGHAPSARTYKRWPVTSRSYECSKRWRWDDAPSKIKSDSGSSLRMWSIRSSHVNVPSFFLAIFRYCKLFIFKIMKKIWFGIHVAWRYLFISTCSLLGPSRTIVLNKKFS
jgi:hypothetical protein